MTQVPDSLCSLVQAADLLKQLESLRRHADNPFGGVRVEFAEADWAFKAPEVPLCHLLADASRKASKKCVATLSWGCSSSKAAFGRDG